jgi:hypothetical protein
MRRYRNVILVFALLLSATWASAQSVKKIAVDKQRAVQWKPATGQYYFSHSLVFDYENKADKTKGTVKIYVDPVTGAMCFRKESSFGQSGKAYDFIIGFPDGKYIYCGADDKGKKIKVTEMVKEFKPDAETKTQQKEDFITYCVPTGNKRQDFDLESAEYDLSYATSETKDKLWLTKTPFSIYALYGIEFVEGTVSLPVSFDYMYLLPSNELITELNAKDATLKLTGFGRDPFTAVTKGYQEVKVND